jgi:7,8-dihydropterin-6-yl-methyl-4-(beta-D-ribofuranosyl)aminobenzene 5'-phosphate synthase
LLTWGLTSSAPPARRPSRQFLHSIYSTRDRRKLQALKVQPIISEAPIVVEGHAFTTGAVPRTSIERVVPNTWVEYGVHDGVGCDTKAYMDHHFTPEELAGKPVPDQHWHEHATCFNVGIVGS